MQKHLIIGRGEVGSSLASVLSEVYDVATYDITDGLFDIRRECDVLHICIPYNKDFLLCVNNYLATVNASLCIIHSTLPPDTLGIFEAVDIVYSPVRGVHPKMEQSLNTFVKYVGGKDKDKVNEAIDILRIAGIEAFEMPLKDLIFMKLLSTTQYGIHIAIAKFINDICKQEELNYENVYTNANRTYNAGYRQLRMPYVQRPILYAPPDNKIDSHCIIENSVLLDKYFSKDDVYYDLIDNVQELDWNKASKLLKND